MRRATGIGIWLLVILLFGVQCGSSSNEAQTGDASNDTATSGDTTTPGGDTTTPDGDTSPYQPDLASGLYLQPGHPKVLLNAEVKARLQKKLSDKTKDALAFQQIVDTSVAGDPVYNFDWSNAALLYQLTGDESYCEAAITAVDAIVSDAETAIDNGQVPEVAGDSYLYVGETVAEIMLTYDWCYDKLSTDQRERWFAYSNQAVWNVWNHEQASWGGTPHPWSGWSVDNPSNNYYYSFLRATMILGLATKGEKSEADTWLSTFRTEKLDNQLFPTFKSDLIGGGSREGTGYGISMRSLYQLFAIWEASTNERLYDKTPHAYDTAFYLMHAVLPTLDYIAPIGDHARESTGKLFDYHREFMLVLTGFFADQPLGHVGQQWLSQIAVAEMSQHFTKVTEFLFFDPTIPTQALSTLYPVYYAPGTGHVFMRSSWSKDATWANFIAGPYTESHAHQDQGSFLIYKKGWLAYDENVATHSGIQQGTNMHNLVRLVRNGTPMPQREGSKPGKLFGLRDDATLTYLASDLAPVYDDTYVAAVERRMLFIKPDLFVIFDLVSSSGDLDTVWQLNTPINPTIDTGVATLSGPNATLRVEMLEPESGSFETIGWTGQDDITGGGYQLQFSQKGTTNRYLTVLSLDGALTSAIRTTDLDSIGATLTLADGRTVHVRFTNLNHGTTVVIEQGGSEIYNESFDETLQELPRFAN